MFGEGLKIRGEIYTKFSLKIVPKALIAITLPRFLKNFRGSLPPYLLELLLFLDLPRSNSAGKKCQNVV